MKRSQRVKQHNDAQFQPRTIESNAPIKIKFLNKTQKEYGDIIKSNIITIATGPAGTGKTTVPLLLAIQAFQEGHIEKIVLCRPAIVACEDDVGFLPGTIYDKLYPYMKPLFDILEDYWNPKYIKTLIEYNKLEIAPFGYLRGRTMKNAFIIADEAQNCSKDQIIMLLTRIGENSKMILAGDIDQRDITHSGLEYAKKKLDFVKGVGFIEFNRSHIVRHPIIQDILQAWHGRSYDTLLETLEPESLPNFISAPITHLNGHGD